jgi:hypothetical protein
LLSFCLLFISPGPQCFIFQKKMSFLICSILVLKAACDYWNSNNSFLGNQKCLYPYLCLAILGNHFFYESKFLSPLLFLHNSFYHFACCMSLEQIILFFSVKENVCPFSFFVIKHILLSILVVIILTAATENQIHFIW